MADGRMLQVGEMTRRVDIALHTKCGPVTLDPFALADMPGTDDVLILECLTLEILSLDTYARLMGCARWKVERRTMPVESFHYTPSRRVDFLVKATEQQPMDDEQVTH